MSYSGSAKAILNQLQFLSGDFRVANNIALAIMHALILTTTQLTCTKLWKDII